MLASLDGGLAMFGSEAGRLGHEHHVDAAFDELLKGVQADELPLGRHVDPAAETLVGRRIVATGLPFGEIREARLQAVGKGIWPWPKA